MKILFVAATQPEINPALATLQQEGFDVLITGAGMVATAYHLGKGLQENSYDLLVNVGIAGSFSKDVQLGDVVHVVQDCFIEQGAEDQHEFLSMEQLGLGQSVFENTAAISSNSLSTLQTVHGITVNTVHGNAHSINTLKSRIPELTVESMEGAAVFYAAQQSGIPCIQVRAISNYVEPRDRDRWEIGLAIEHLNTWILAFIGEIKG